MARIRGHIRYLDIIFSRLYRNRKELDFTESHYYRINQILLSTVQLWPYEKSMLTTVNRILLLTLLLSLVFFQLTTFFTFEHTVNVFVMVLSYVVPYFLVILSYFFFYININEMKQIWQNIYDIWKNLKNETERNIMRRYSHIGELTTIYLTLVFTIGFGIYTSIQFSPVILDMILPLNESRPRKVYALTEYFVDGEIYYYPILCHWLVGVFLSILIVLATFTYFVVYIQHICGLLKIVCYRTRQSVERDMVSNSEKNDRNSIQKISSAVDIHQLALKYADSFRLTLTSLVIVIIIMGTTSLCLIWFRFMIAAISHDISDQLTAAFLIGAHLLILLFGHYCGQIITDHDNEIFDNAYDVRWYVAPIEMQKIILFIMQKTTKPYCLNIGNILPATIENFKKLFKILVSYFTVIYSFMNW